MVQKCTFTKHSVFLCICKLNKQPYVTARSNTPVVPAAQQLHLCCRGSSTARSCCCTRLLRSNSDFSDSQSLNVWWCFTRWGVFVKTATGNHPVPKKRRKLKFRSFDFHLRFWEFSNHLAINKLACILFKLIETFSKHFILLMIQKSQGQPPGIKKPCKFVKMNKLPTPHFLDLSNHLDPKPAIHRTFSMYPRSREGYQPTASHPPWLENTTYDILVVRVMDSIFALLPPHHLI